MSKIKSCDCRPKCPSNDINDNQYVVASLIPKGNSNANKDTIIRNNQLPFKVEEVPRKKSRLSADTPLPEFIRIKRKITNVGE